jgi:hypothetical protein
MFPTIQYSLHFGHIHLSHSFVADEVTGCGVAFRILTTHQQHRKVLYRQVEELEGARHWLQSQRASWLGLGLTRAPPPSPYPY